MYGAFAHGRFFPLATAGPRPDDDSRQSVKTAPCAALELFFLALVLSFLALVLLHFLVLLLLLLFPLPRC